MKNWARNVDYHSSSMVSPTSVGELAEIVAATTHIKPLGSRHCFNTIADTAGTHLRLDALATLPEIDSGRGIVRVSGATTYGSLARAVQAHGYALHNMASLPHISVAGALATGTHGSGVTNGGLASAVRAIELVRASGDVDRLDESDGDEFYASVVGLGALGVVTHVELAIQPTFTVRQQVFENLSWETLLSDFDSIVSDGYSLSLFTDYVGDTVGQVWRKIRDDDRPAPDTFFGATPATTARHPLPEMSGATCTQQFDVPGPWLDRLPHFRAEFTPSNGDELQSEYLIPRSVAPQALQGLRSMADSLSPLVYISEIRTVAGDDHWLSPSHHRDSVALHFTWKPRQREVEDLLPALEAVLEPFGARPHWGKLFAADADRLGVVYPRIAEFRTFATKYDPTGKFCNAFLDRVLFGR